MVDTSQSFVSWNEHLLARRKQFLRYAGRYVREIHVYRLHDSKIREHRVEMATMELLQQIGALPQPDLEGAHWSQWPKASATGLARGCG